MKPSTKASFWATFLHEDTNHKYDGLPYSVHLNMVQEEGRRHVGLLAADDVESVFAAIWAHDLIEDCRVTYNDVKKELGEQVADIVYAVTNEKGKTRKERANDKFYQELKQNKLAVFVKICDRLVNMRYSLATFNPMALMYAKEADDFCNKLHCTEYQPMFDEIYHLVDQIKEKIKPVEKSSSK